MGFLFFGPILWFVTEHKMSHIHACIQSPIKNFFMEFWCSDHWELAAGLTGLEQLEKSLSVSLKCLCFMVLFSCCSFDRK